MTVANTAKDHDTNFTLARVVMLPKDVTNLMEESSEAIKCLLVMQQVQVSVLNTYTSQIISFNLLSTF